MANYLPVLLISVNNAIPDDSSVSTLPRGQVDYLSHDWREEDVWRSWRNMTRQKNEIANGARLENASWRTWWKQRNRLKTISPETLNWLKDSDVTWLYGPLHTALDWEPTPKPDPPPPPPSSPNPPSIPNPAHNDKPHASDTLDMHLGQRNRSGSASTVALGHRHPHAHAKPMITKPILKHRSITDLLTSALPVGVGIGSGRDRERERDAYDEYDEDGGAERHGHAHGHGHGHGHGQRPPLTHTKSESNIDGRGHLNPFRRASPPRIIANGHGREHGHGRSHSYSHSTPYTHEHHQTHHHTPTTPTPTNASVVTVHFEPQHPFQSEFQHSEFHSGPSLPLRLESRSGSTSGSGSSDSTSSMHNYLPTPTPTATSFSTSIGSDTDGGVLSTGSASVVSWSSSAGTGLSGCGCGTSCGGCGVGNANGSGRRVKQKQKQKEKHITFNTFVEQCIAIEKPVGKRGAGRGKKRVGRVCGYDDGYDEDSEGGYFDESPPDPAAASEAEAEAEAQVEIEEGPRFFADVEPSDSDEDEDDEDDILEMRRHRSSSSRSASASSSCSRSRSSSSLSPPSLPTSIPHAGSALALRPPLIRTPTGSGEEPLTIAPIAPTMLKTSGRDDEVPTVFPDGCASVYGLDRRRRRRAGAGAGRGYFGLYGSEGEEGEGEEDSEKDGEGEASVELVYSPPVGSNYSVSLLGLGLGGVGEVHHHRETYGAVGLDVSAGSPISTAIPSIGMHSYGAMPFYAPHLVSSPEMEVEVEVGDGIGIGMEENAYDYFGGPDLGEDFARAGSGSGSGSLRRVRRRSSGEIVDRGDGGEAGLVRYAQGGAASVTNGRRRASFEKDNNPAASSSSSLTTPTRDALPEQPAIVVPAPPPSTSAIPVPRLNPSSHPSPSSPPTLSSSTSNASTTSSSLLLSPPDARPSRGRSLHQSPTGTGSSGSDSNSNTNRSESRGRSAVRSSSSFSDRERSGSRSSRGTNSPMGSISPVGSRGPSVIGIGAAYAYGSGGREIERDREGVIGKSLFRKTSEDAGVNGRGGRGRPQAVRRVSDSLSPPSPSPPAQSRSPPQSTQRPPSTPNPASVSETSSLSSSTSTIQQQSKPQKPSVVIERDLVDESKSMPIRPSVADEEERRSRHPTPVNSPVAAVAPMSIQAAAAAPSPSPKTRGGARMISKSNVATSRDGTDPLEDSGLISRAVDIVTSARGFLGSIWNTNT